ncbi:hypothetical protein CBR_g38437 [Chara braunii]|uniref:SCP domain-containing protein n=1 Tax=Chara braunii TaxID=69332 RepID=A0A388JNQ6_CHABU|nr:hypothetical protein CBR_g38437 [Chara braunii]|eukprot:GBG59411.1 hypothetical protein CBR_g38437 [Chara braunii]
MTMTMGKHQQAVPAGRRSRSSWGYSDPQPWTPRMSCASLSPAVGVWLVLGVALCAWMVIIVAQAQPSSEDAVIAAINDLRRNATVKTVEREDDLNCAARRRVHAISPQNCTKDDIAARAAVKACDDDKKDAYELAHCGNDAPVAAWAKNGTIRQQLLNSTYDKIGVARNTMNNTYVYVVILARHD